MNGRTPPADFIVSICEHTKATERWLLTGKGTKFIVPEPEPKPDPLTANMQIAPEQLHLMDKLNKTLEILQSGTSFAGALGANIEAFYLAIISKEGLPEAVEKQKTEGTNNLAGG